MDEIAIVLYPQKQPQPCFIPTIFPLETPMLIPFHIIQHHFTTSKPHKTTMSLIQTSRTPSFLAMKPPFFPMKPAIFSWSTPTHPMRRGSRSALAVLAARWAAWKSELSPRSCERGRKGWQDRSMDLEGGAKSWVATNGWERNWFTHGYPIIIKIMMGYPKMVVSLRYDGFIVYW